MLPSRADLKVAKLLEGTDLNRVCAFRMAAKDIRSGKLLSAAWRIRQDLDKMTREEREAVRNFLENHK